MELNDLLGSDSDDDVNRVEDSSTVNLENDKTVDESKTELNDLLGDSDDEIEHNDGNTSSNLNDLLGSDDDEDHVFDDNKLSNDSIRNSNDELDQILGANTVSTSTQETKAVSSSSLYLPESLIIEDKIETFFFRTPNFIKIQTERFESNTHNKENEKLQLGNTTAVIRYRYKTDENGQIVYDSNGNALKESNAKLVRWDDGSYQLVVGDAVFSSKMVVADSCYVYEHQKSVDPNSHMNDDDDEEEEEKNKEETCLKCTGAIQQRMILQPTSIDSETHAKMSLKISDTFKKETKISIRDYEKITENPEKTLNDLARKEDDQNRRDLKIRQQAEYRMGGGAAMGRYSSGGGPGGSRRPAMSAEYLNEDSMFESENLAHLKKKIKSGNDGRKPQKTSRADSDNDDEYDYPRRSSNTKKRRDEDEDEGDEEAEEDDDDEELLDDEDEDDDEGEDLGEEDSMTEDEGDDEDDEEEEKPQLSSSSKSKTKKISRADRGEDEIGDTQNSSSNSSNVGGKQGIVSDGEDDNAAQQQQQRGKRAKLTIVESDEDDEN